jgi:SAM-dependent methyltransferase
LIQRALGRVDRFPAVRHTLKGLVPGRLVPPVRGIQKRYRLLRGPERGRNGGLDAEVAFWKGWFDRDDANLDKRLDPELTNQVVLDCLAQISTNDVSILDVGAGPLSTLGSRMPGRVVRLTAVDPLADQYNRILSERGINPPVQTIACAGEDLLARFGPESFDIAFSENALDHALHPARIIHQMWSLIRPGGFVILIHNRNEAEHGSYGELHQWNFDERNKHCIVWREGSVHDVQSIVGSGIEKCWRGWRQGSREIVTSVIQKPLVSQPQHRGSPA